MNWLHLQMAVLDVARAVVSFAANWLLQSTLLIALGLTIAWLMRHRGSALQSAVYRTTLATVIVCPLTSTLLAFAPVSGWSPPMPQAWTYYEPSAPPLADAEPAREIDAGPRSRRWVEESTLSWQSPPKGDSSRTVVGAPSEPLPPSLVDGRVRSSTADASALNGLSPGESARPAADPAVLAAEASSKVVHGPAGVFRVRAFGLVAMAMALTWLSASGWFLARLRIAWLRLDRLCQEAAPAEPAMQEACRQVTAMLAVATPPVLRSPYLSSPCLAGWPRPRVLLPEADPSLPAHDVLIHELAHLRRGDAGWNLVGRLTEALFFYQPLVWMLTHRLETAAEEVCDDYVVQFGGDRSRYARGLVEIAELSTPVATTAVAIVSLKSILARRVTRIMDPSRSLSTRIGNVLLAVVIAGGLIGTVAVGFVGLGSRRSLANAEAQPESVAKSDREQEDGEDREDGDDREDDDREDDDGEDGDEQAAASNELRGIVTGADGKPVSGAKLWWLRTRVHDVQPPAPQLLATTGEDGRYHFTEPAAVAESIPASWEYIDRIAVTAPGHGFVLTSAGEIRRDAGQAEGFVAALARAVAGAQSGAIHLPAAGEPIRGRLVDIDGRPVVGATVRIRWFNDETDQFGGVEEAKARGAENPIWSVRVGDLLNIIEPVQLRDVLPVATTDSDGRFELRDIGPKRLLHLLAQGERIESTDIVARNEPGEKIVVDSDRHTQGSSLTVYPNEFVQAVGPSKPVEGRVLDLGTGEPIAGAVVRAFHVHGQPVSGSREREHFAATTDEAGRYRITGLPVGKDNALVAFAIGDVAYLPVAHNADTSAGGATTQDFRLKRGLWAEGRVFDAQTQKTFTGEITYYLFRDRELEEAIPGLRQAYVDGLYWTNAGGKFRVPVASSRGILAFRYAGRGMDREGIDRFARGFGTNEILGSEDFGGTKIFPTIPHHLMPGNYERVAEVPATSGDKTVRVDMPLFASRPVEVRVADASGDPVSQFLAYGANERIQWQTLDGPSFEIQDLLPGERRKVFVFHRGRKLAGGGFVESGKEQALQISLVEAGSVQGRLVDADGEPINDATLSVDYEKLNSADNSAVWAPHPKLHANPTKIPVDKDGRFRLDGLIPGWSYHAHASAPRPYQGRTLDIIIGTALKGVEVKAGENKDLGDIVIADRSGSDSAADAEKASAAPPADAKTVRGRVTRGGKPAGGAHLAVVAHSTATARGGDFSSHQSAVLAEATADEKGEYVLRLVGVSQKTHTYANLIARQDGSGVAWKQLNLDAPRTAMALDLSDEQPIRGKLIDLEGQPASSVRMSIVSVIEPANSGRAGSGAAYRGDKVPAAWLLPIVSDEQGGFVIHGVAANHGVMLELAGDDRFAPQDIALNTGWPEQRGERDGTYRPLVKNSKPGEEIVLTLSPAQLFEGVVKYADTNQPAPGARLTIWASQQEPFGSMVSVAGRADSKGHYRISPKPGIRFGVTAYPPDGAPYLARQTPLDKAVRWQGGERLKQVDMMLPRGVLLRGKVVEAGSDVPVARAAVQYLPETSSNRNASDDILTGWQAIEVTDDEGRFSIAVLPGPGRLLVSGPQGKYVFREIGDRELGQGKPGGTRNYFHSITELNLAADQQRLELAIELQPGATVRGRVVDEAGNAIDEMLVISRLDISPHSPFWRAYGTSTLGERFELSGLAEGVEYPVYFLDPKRKLGATEIVKAGEEERTVVLKPCGKATLRALDNKGEPVRDFGSVDMVVTPGASRYDADAARRGELSADADFVANVDRTNHALAADDDGRLNLSALIPGATYQVNGIRTGRWRVVKEFQVKANEMLDLGDLVVQDQQ